MKWSSSGLCLNCRHFPYVFLETNYFKWLSLYILTLHYMFLCHILKFLRYDFSQLVWSVSQVAAGLFVLLVRSSSVSSLLKLLYLQPIMFSTDPWNLEGKNEEWNVICGYSLWNGLRNGHNGSVWRTCFNHVMTLWSQTVWHSLVCEPSVLSGTGHRLQNSELCKACLPLQETKERIHERCMGVTRNLNISLNLFPKWIIAEQTGNTDG